MLLRNYGQTQLLKTHRMFLETEIVHTCINNVMAHSLIDGRTQMQPTVPLSLGEEGSFVIKSQSCRVSSFSLTEDSLSSTELLA